MSKSSQDLPPTNPAEACSVTELQSTLRIWERCQLADKHLSEALADPEVDARLAIAEKILAQFDAVAEESLELISTPSDLPRYETLLQDWLSLSLPAFEKQYAPGMSKRKLARYRRLFEQKFGQWEGYIPGTIDPAKISARVFHWRAAAAAKARLALGPGQSFRPQDSDAIPAENLHSQPLPEHRRSTRDRSKWKPTYRKVVEEYERECRAAGVKATLTSIFQRAGIGNPSNGYKALRGEREGYWRSIRRVCTVEKPHLQQNLTM